MRPIRIVSLLGLAFVASFVVAQDPPPRPRVRSKTYGTTDVSYIAVPGSAFFPVVGGSPYSTGGPGYDLRWVTAGPIEFVAPMPHIPAGAQIVELELDYEDNSPFWEIEGSLMVCDYLGQACTRHPAAGAGALDCSSPGYMCSGISAAPGPSSLQADLTPDNIFVNNYDYKYVLFARPQSYDGSTKIAGMIVGYRLQVSAPPPTPTFNDVPATDPAFQFIEALARSGISVGCGGGNYCPDAPLTRRQMAVFLAKALGLHFQ